MAFGDNGNLLEMTPTSLILLAFTLGLRHGLDPDHLATVDALTRFNAQRGNRVARWCGLLFSAGHGSVVVAGSAVVGIFSASWEIPRWIETAGEWMSVAILIALGVLNLRAVFRTPATQMVAGVGFKQRLFGRFQQTANPMLVFGIGALFALSFETISQTSLYALTATQFAGWLGAVLLGVAFLLGMMVTDGINGLWVSHLMRRADQVARIASRVIGSVVGGLSLLIGGVGLAQRCSPDFARWSDGKALVFGWGVIAVMGSGFLAAVILARRKNGNDIHGR